MSKRVVITVGGTGGHVFPAISLGRQLLQKHPDIELLYVGGDISSNPYFDRELFDHQSVSCATFKSKNPWAILKTLGKISLGIIQSHKILKDFNPDLVVGFGSYYTLPLLIAAKLKKIPFILHEANSIPGKVNKLLAKYAEITGIHFPDTAKFLKGRTCEVGLPLRPGYHLNSCSKEQALLYFDLDPYRKTVLVFGGSQGALNLNRIVKDAFIKHIDANEWQLIHLAGNMDLERILRDEYKKVGIKTCVKAFENRMDLAWQAADLSIARAGAGTIAEQLEFEVPGILIPYPHATDNHQERNADFLTKTVKGSLTYLEKDLTASTLAEAICSLTGERYYQMKNAMNQYKKNDRPQDFCNLIKKELNI